MLDAIVAFVAVLLVAAGIVVMIGPRNVMRHIPSVRRPSRLSSMLPARPVREVAALNPRTQRVALAANRLANWMKTHEQNDAARDLRSAAARLAGNEAAGLYALHTTLRRIRVVNITDSAAHERLRALVDELRNAVEDRFEQLELLPFKKS